MTRRRTVLVAAGIVLLGLAIWVLSGGVERVVRGRIETALVEQGLPAPLASCMAERLSTRLTLGQLRDLQQLQPDPGPEPQTLAMVELLERARRIDDPQVVQVLGTSAAICAFATGLAV